MKATPLTFALLLAGLLAACPTGSGTLTVPGTPGTPGPASPTTTTMTVSLPTPPTVDTGTPPTTGTEPDCSAVPDGPLSVTRLEGISPSEEFAFDDTGWLYNLPDGHDAVFRALYGEDAELFAPFSSVEVAGVRVLPDGGLAVANEQAGSVERVDLASGARTVIVAGINQPNSLAVGPDGRLYVAAFAEILRVDPGAPDVVERLLSRPGTDLDGLTFAPGYEALYFNQDEDGTIGLLRLDADGEVLGTEILADISLGFGFVELDGMTTDACGNVYVVRTDGEIWRVSPQGEAQQYAAAPDGGWTTALHFGSGVGGWQRDHLYLMDRGEGLVDIDAGVDGL